MANVFLFMIHCTEKCIDPTIEPIIMDCCVADCHMLYSERKKLLFYASEMGSTISYTLDPLKNKCWYLVVFICSTVSIKVFLKASPRTVPLTKNRSASMAKLCSLL